MKIGEIKDNRPYKIVQYRGFQGEVKYISELPPNPNTSHNELDAYRFYEEEYWICYAMAAHLIFSKGNICDDFAKIKIIDCIENDV